MLIGIGTHVDTAILPPAYFNHIAAIGCWSRKYELTFIGIQRLKVAAARNRITEEANELNCDYLVLVDSDHVLPFNMLDLLLENKDAALVSGLVCKRYFPYETVAFKEDGNGDLQEVFVPSRDKVVEVDATALGCTLINLSYLRKLPQPYWFDGHFRSDLNMCISLKKLGGKILLDTRVHVGHISDPQVVFPDTAEENRIIDINRILTRTEYANVEK